MTRNHLRRLQPQLHMCAEHFAVHGFDGMTAGEIAVACVRIEALEKSLKDLHDLLKEGEATEAVNELMQNS